jgi:hypothetical protein
MWKGVEMKYDNRNPNYRNPNKKTPVVKVKSEADRTMMRAAMRSGELSHDEYSAYGNAIQDEIEEARD